MTGTCRRVIAGLFGFGFALFVAGCASSTVVATGGESQDAGRTQTERVVGLGVVAVAEVEIPHPAAQLVYRELAVRDMLSTVATHNGAFNVIDWRRLDAVVFRRNLEWSDLFDDRARREEVREILLNDYFLTATVSSFGERMEHTSSSFSRRRTQIAEVRVELLLKDALTNEILVSTQAQAEARRNTTQALGFGAGGGSDPSLANDAMLSALESGIRRLVDEFQRSGVRN